MRVYLITLLIIFLPLASAYDFPKKDGNHFIFESDWENRFSINQNNNTIIPEHSFSVHNTSLPIYVQFKKLAMDNNHCYNNDSWDVSLSLYHDYNLIAIENITDFRCEPIEIEPYIIYTLKLRVAYDTNQMIDGKYHAIIQMNVINDDIDEPHYFFETVNFKYAEPQKRYQDLTPIIILILIILMVIYITIKTIKSKRR